LFFRLTTQIKCVVFRISTPIGVPGASAPAGVSKRRAPSAKGPSAISWPQTHHDGGVGRAGSGCSGSGGTEQHGTLSKALGHS